MWFPNHRQLPNIPLKSFTVVNVSIETFRKSHDFKINWNIFTLVLGRFQRLLVVKKTAKVVNPVGVGNLVRYFAVILY